jgi:hypothetical protein
MLGLSLLSGLAVILVMLFFCWFVSVQPICGLLLSAQQWLRNSLSLNVDLFDCSVQTKAVHCTLQEHITC